MAMASQLRTALLVASFLAPVALPAAARADVSADQASQLEAQLTAWLSGLLGPNVPVPPRPFHVAAEGDHYRIGVDTSGDYGDVTVSGDPFSVLVKPLDGSRWQLDEARIPSPWRFEGKGPDNKPTSMAVKIADQTATGVVDPSFATASSFDTTIRGYTATNSLDAGTSTIHMDRYTAHNVWQPVGDGRVTFSANGRGEHLSSDQVGPDGTPVKVSVDAFEFMASAGKVSIDNATALIHRVTDLIPIIKATQGKSGNGVPDEAKAPLKAMVAELSNLAAGMEEQYSLKGLKVDAGGHGGGLANMTMGLGFAAPGGRADIHMLVALDGLNSPELPPGPMSTFIPKHIGIRPRVSGVPMADIVALANHAIDSNGQDQDALTAEALALLAKGPLTVGFDDFAMDSGPATLKGTGTVEITSPQQFSGKGQFRATGFDALIQQSSTNPMLKQAGPVLIFLKGIGKPDGDAMVWNIAYQDNKMLVNGTDLSAMIPGK